MQPHYTLMKGAEGGEIKKIYKQDNSPYNIYIITIFAVALSGFVVELVHNISALTINQRQEGAAIHYKYIRLSSVNAFLL